MTLRPFTPALLLLAPTLLHAQKGTSTTVTHAPFGTLPDNGGAVELYTLADKELEVKIMTFGAHVTSIQAADRTGTKSDVVLGYADLPGYLADNKTYMGSVVGRYGNRIAHGTFTLDGQQYHLPQNDHGNTLHGGTTGFDRLNWTGKVIPSGVELTLVSPDGDQGFPGKLTAHVRYTLHGDTLRVEYSATTTKPTVINLTNHSYFNLAGSGDILGEMLLLNAPQITPVDATLIPTGKLMAVSGSAFDFTMPARIGARIDADDPQLKIAGGYDHNFVLAKTQSGSQSGSQPSLAPVLARQVKADPALHLAAEAFEPTSGRTLAVMTTEPGVQFYSGNFLDGSFHGASGETYNKHAGFCLETQHYPDSPNHPNFPTTTLNPGQTYRSTTTFTFGTDASPDSFAKGFGK